MTDLPPPMPSIGSSKTYATSPSNTHIRDSVFDIYVWSVCVAFTSNVCHAISNPRTLSFKTHNDNGICDSKCNEP